MMTHPQLLELAFGIGLLANGVLCVYQIVRFLKNKAKLKENETNIEGVTFKDIVDKIPAHIYWKDLEGRCLGASELQYQNLGLSKQEYLGKTDFDFFPKDIAEKIREVDKKVLLSGISMVCEETTLHLDGDERLCLSHKIPLRNKDKKIVALLGVSVDVHDIRKKEIERKNLLESIIALMPGHVYWSDRQGVWQGCNDLQAKNAGLSSRFDIIGLRNHDLPWNAHAPEVSKFIDQVNEEVMSSGQIKILEEPVSYLNGLKGVCLTTKAPLRDGAGNITGMLGISIDITEKKEAERALKEAKEKADLMNTTALQVAHDIRSPLAAILMLTQACVEIPETQRVCLREAVDRIHDIADQLLTKHRKEDLDSNTLSPVLVSTALLSVLASKRVEYQRSKIKIVFESSAESYFAFIHANLIELKRMVSNLINNAMEAFESDMGEVKVSLHVDESQLILKVADTGRGMPQEKVQQILSDSAITTEKETGFGLGLTHAKKMLKRFNARLNIKSSLNNGCIMELMFDLSPVPKWMAKSIDVHSGDCIVVLDDDVSIHGAWDEIFSELIKDSPALRLKHFTYASECLDYINAYVNPEKLLLLTDYELIDQSMNGLDVIRKIEAQRAILVTSHYENRDVIQRAIRLNTKILPKMLASHVKLNLIKLPEETNLTQVDLILLDDDELFPMAIEYVFRPKGKVLKHYSTPEALLKEVSNYSKNTPICTDFDLKDSLNGVEVAEILHEQGFTHLYIASGYSFQPGEVPAYLHILKEKSDILNI